MQGGPALGGKICLGAHMDGILIGAAGFGILLISGIAVMAYLDRHAPFGWQDEKGFHFGRGPGRKERASGTKAKRDWSNNILVYMKGHRR